MLRIGDAEGHRDVAHDHENAGDSLTFVGGLRQLAHVVRRPDEPVLRLDGTGQILVAVLVLPRRVELQLLVVGGAVGHHLVLAAVVDHRLAGEVFDDRRVAGGVGHRQVHGRVPRIARAEVHRNDVDRRVGEGVDHLVDGGVVGQHVVDPAREGQPRPVVGRRGAEVGLTQVEQVGHQAGGVHPVEDAVDRALRIGGAGHLDRAELAGPRQRVHSAAAVLGAAGRNRVQVRIEGVGPVHGPPGDHHAVRPEPGHATARLRCRRQTHQGGYGQHRCGQTK